MKPEAGIELYRQKNKTLSFLLINDKTFVLLLGVRKNVENKNWFWRILLIAGYSLEVYLGMV